MRKLFNNNWKFAKFNIDTTYDTVRRIIDNEGTDEDKALVMQDFKCVDVPHDWMIDNTDNLYETSTGVYVKHFNADNSKLNLIYFEGVYMNTTVYINGEKACFWPYGYSSFEVDTTSFQKDGDNEIIVMSEYREPNTRWYSGAGIFRDVWFDEKEREHLVTNGVYFNAEMTGDGNYKVTIDTECIKTSAQEITFAEISHSLTDADGNEVISVKIDQRLYREPVINSQCFFVERPVLWDIQNPYLYTLKTVLTVNGEVKDCLTQRVGFRTIDFNNNKGFFLNGRHVKIHGACMHHDLGALGAAFNGSALRRQFRELKKMGINSVRTSHNMPSVRFMEIADEMGMLIDSEAFDMWEQNKTKYDYGNYFHDYCERDVESWVRRDRNHPSLIMWSIGNEIPDTNNEGAEKIAIRLRDAVRRNDYRHNGYTTIGSNYVAWDNAQKCSDVLELSGYNYLEAIYEEHHNVKHKDWCIYGSETSSTVQSRGIYHFPKSNGLLTYNDMQCSCLDNCTTNWGARNVHKTITDDRDAEYCFGQYIWTGWDYIGEPTPYFSKNSFFGHIDTAGFWKDTAYIFKAAWVSAEEDPFIHISPYWDFNPGQEIDVCVYSNAARVALYMNDELVGEKELDHEKDINFSAQYRIKYEEGKLEAVGYDCSGKEIARDTISSFGNPVKLHLSPESETVKADGEDLMFVGISALDCNGVEVANARNRVFVKVEGEGRLIGMDNGDSTDYDQYKCSTRKLFSGKAMAIIAPTLKAGRVKVTVSSEGMEDAVFEYSTTEASHRQGVSCDYRVPEMDKYSENPVRKITLVCNGETTLNPGNSEVTVEARISPEDATYKDIAFKALALTGIESNCVKIEADGNKAVIKAAGDGEFRLQCSAANGKDHAEVISELEFTVSDFGSATLDPYTEEGIHGCQYAKCNVKADLSLKGGINIWGDTIIVSFEDIDFGEYGSDELGFSIFSFRDNEEVEIWEGEPESSELLFKGTYSMPTKYNVLQENIFKLSKRLKGIGGITFKSSSGFVFGGFRMIYKEKAYGQINTTERNMINGDYYEEKADGIYSIGNNTDIEFLNMNFTKGVSGIEITGRSNTAVNPVHVRFNSGEGNINQICNFEKSDEIITRTFSLDDIRGNGKINFIFMPGSDFDFISFRFIEREE